MVRRRSRKKTLKNFILKLLIVLSLFALIGGIYLFSKNNLFKISKVNLTLNSADCVSSEQIKKIITDQNILFLNSTKIEKQIREKHICIKSVFISKIFPNKISVEVSGREPAAILMVGSQNIASLSAEASESGTINFVIDQKSKPLLVDETGVIFSEDIGQKNIPRIYVSEEKLVVGKNLEGGVTKQALEIINKLRIFNLEIKEVKIDSGKNLIINSNPKLIFSLNKSVDIQLASLQLILEKAKIDKEIMELIDLRFDNPVVKYAPKNN